MTSSSVISSRASGASAPGRLELGNFVLDEVSLESSLRLDQRRLTVDPDEIRRAVANPAVTDVAIEVVHPGEAARITQITDVVEPRIKVSGRGDVFPGLFGLVEPVGSGRTHRLGNVAVMVTGEVPWLGASGLFVPRDNFVDTAGLGADFTPHSQTINVVLRLTFAEGFTHEDYERAVVLASTRAAHLLATATRSQTPDDLQVRDLSISDPALPRVLYAYQVQSQGVFMRTYLNGRILDELFPTLLHPNELADGALVSGGLGGGAVKLTTWLHQNNPVVDGMFARHGKEWSFAGLILHRGHYYQYEDKQRVALQLVRQAQVMRADGIVFSLGGGGNNITEVMLAIQLCEQMGIKTVLLAWEHGGPEGRDYPLPFAVPEAVAIVSTGSMDERVELPAPQRLVGASSIRVRPEVGGVQMDVGGALDLSNRYELFGDANPAGWSRGGCREF